jgi:hypothetical protein
MRRARLSSGILCWILDPEGRAMGKLAVSREGPSGLSWAGEPLELWGVRAASAAMHDGWTDSLIEQLDVYARYGVNAFTVGYQGSSGGCRLTYAPDGSAIDEGVQRRMERIIDAAARRAMIVVVHTLFRAQRGRLDPERGAWLADAASYPRALELVARKLARFENVMINVCGEHNTGWQACPYPVGTAEGILGLCRAVKRGDPNRLVGGGGVHPGLNEAFALHPETDVLFFDSSGASVEAVTAYRAAGAVKPLLNVEVFGGTAEGFVEESAESSAPGVDVTWPGWNTSGAPLPAGRRQVQGVFPERREGRHKSKADFLAEIEFAARTPGFSLFGHFPAWYQGASRNAAFDCRFDLGGSGTREVPGLRWYFEAVAQARGRSAASASR